MQPSPEPPRPVPIPLDRHAVRADPVRLPEPLTSLVGRERHIAELVALLRDPAARLVTLTGPGGVGKTRLALRSAADLLAEPRFADGVVFVDLAPVRDLELVAPAIAQALGVRPAGQEPVISAVKVYLRIRRCLLILDNFEQVSEAGPIVTDLLHACPDLCVLVTSRSLLNVSGEQAMPVPPLSLARRGDAVALFAERTRVVNPGFALTEANAPVIAEIVRRLDGLPLAIELAAARGALFSPADLLARLDRRLPHLTGGPRDQPARHQTMRAAIAWSYDLLTTEEQRVFRCLGIFVGGCTVDAAEAVCAIEGGSVSGEGSASGLAVTSALESLTRQSLVRAIVPSEGGPESGSSRVVMLETIREFAVEQLAERAEQEPGRRHAEYYAALAVEAEPTYWGDVAGDRRAAIDLEIGNLRAAVDWAVVSGETDLALRLASARFDPHWTTGAAHAHLLRRSAHQALAMPGGSPIERVRALATAAWLAHVHADYDAVRALGGEALILSHAHGDAFGAASASFVLGVAAFHVGDLDDARPHLEGALDGFRRLNMPGRVAWTLLNLSGLDSRAALDEGGDAIALARAASLVEEADAIFRELGNVHGVARAVHCHAYIAYKQRAFGRALALSREVLFLDWEHGWPIYYHLEDIADIAGRSGQAVVAARLYGAADGLRQRAGRPVEPVFREEFERDVAVARRAMGDAAFAGAWEAGRLLPIENIIAEAQSFVMVPAASAHRLTSELDPVTERQAQGIVPASSPTGNSGLTPREHEVLRLLVEGRTDREIAAALSIGQRTAQTHVANLFNKLGVNSRAECAAVAVRRGLA